MKCVPAGGDVWSFIHTAQVSFIKFHGAVKKVHLKTLFLPVQIFSRVNTFPFIPSVHVYVIHKKKTWKCDEVPFHFLIAVVAFKTSVLSLFMHSSPNSIGLKLYFLTFNSESQYLISSSVFFFLYTLSHNTALHVRPNWIGYKS